MVAADTRDREDPVLGSFPLVQPKDRCAFAAFEPKVYLEDGLLPALEQHGRLQLGEGKQAQLLAVSAATIDRILGDGAGVECRRLQFLEGLRPPRRHESPPHAHELAIAVALGQHIHRIGGADIVARRQIVRRRLDRGR